MNEEAEKDGRTLISTRVQAFSPEHIYTIKHLSLVLPSYPTVALTTSKARDTSKQANYVNSDSNQRYVGVGILPDSSPSPPTSPSFPGF
ncbi:uncharacterized protein G2W53_039902 [Senna tora]|uniref:Uncharacterized protein n=1 Tax=Senna tora TaxID=362788 RepID=A0A834W6J1_9FABA|nr:uncharacterized protein G2W53_039902 [Senna tora]